MHDGLTLVAQHQGDSEQPELASLAALDVRDLPAEAPDEHEGKQDDILRDLRGAENRVDPALERGARDGGRVEPVVLEAGSVIVWQRNVHPAAVSAAKTQDLAARAVRRGHGDGQDDRVLLEPEQARHLRREVGKAFAADAAVDCGRQAQVMRAAEPAHEMAVAIARHVLKGIIHHRARVGVGGNRHDADGRHRVW